MKTILSESKIGFLALLLLFMTGCSEAEGPTGPTGYEGSDKVQAYYGFEVDENDPYTVHFTNKSSGDYHSPLWTFGDGNESTEDSPVHTFSDEGVFEVALAVEGDDIDGESKLIMVVEIIDPYRLRGERIVDGNFQDENAWNVGEAGASNYQLSNVAFTEEGLNISNTGDKAFTNVVVWQEIEVEPGEQYFFTAQVEGGGMKNAWLEFHFSGVKPDGSDYAENNLWSLNTWADCGIEPFEGDITQLSCHGEGSISGIVTFEDSISYIVIKSGSYEGTLGPEGITISDLSLINVEDLD